MVVISGANANQPTKAMKNPNHAPWKPRMYGRWQVMLGVKMAMVSAFSSSLMGRPPFMGTSLAMLGLEARCAHLVVEGRGGLSVCV